MKVSGWRHYGGAGEGAFVSGLAALLPSKGDLGQAACSLAVSVCSSGKWAQEFQSSLVAGRKQEDCGCVVLSAVPARGPWVIAP